jgi:hypothetical protein
MTPDTWAGFCYGLITGVVIFGCWYIWGLWAEGKQEDERYTETCKRRLGTLQGE